MSTPDAGLLRHCAEFNALEHQVRATYERGEPTFIEDDAARTEAAMPVYEAQGAIACAMSDTPARTHEGLIAKIQSLVLWDAEILDLEASEIGDVILASICRDALAMAAASASRTANPDAELIALCAQHQARIDAINNSVDPNGDAGTDEAYIRSRDAISAAKPQTLAGIVAKAHAAMAEAKTLDGDYNPDNTMGEIWAWDLVEDLLAGKAGANA